MNKLAVLKTKAMMPFFGLSVNVDGLSDMDSLLGDLIELALKIFQFGGALILVFGIYQLIMAFKDENADAKARAAQMVGVSVALLGMESLLKAVGIVS